MMKSCSFGVKFNVYLVFLKSFLTHRVFLSEIEKPWRALQRTKV